MPKPPTIGTEKPGKLNPQKIPPSLRKAANINGEREAQADNSHDFARERYVSHAPKIKESLAMLADKGTVVQGLDHIKITIADAAWDALGRENQSAILESAARVKGVNSNTSWTAVGRNGCKCEVREFKKLCNDFGVAVPDSVIKGAEEAEKLYPAKAKYKPSRLGDTNPISRA